MADSEQVRKAIKEEDLYKPVRDFYSERGYEVKAEVNYCDVMAVKDNHLLIVEMKTILNLDVILQATQRQRMTEIVYIAVPKKNKILRTARWKNICHLLRRLELGLLLVSIRGEKSYVEEVITPKPFSREISFGKGTKKRNAVLREFNSRHGDYNIGGCTGKKLVTAYRELSIHIAALLDSRGVLGVTELKKMGTDEKKTGSILQKNYYKWFDRVERGKYCLSERGKKELEIYRELADYYINCSNNKE